MKLRFSSLDLYSELAEMQCLLGMRVQQVYDINHKTYLIKLQRQEEKATILFESGSRIHRTQFEWPKKNVPSGFSMKLRKHLKNKRLESLMQLGLDRIVDMQFGTGEVAFHIFVELYDRGNIVLTDFTFTILNVLRPRTDVKDGNEKLLVRETYSIPLPNRRTENLAELIVNNTGRTTLRQCLLPSFEYGAALFEHLLLLGGLKPNMKIADNIEANRVANILDSAEEFVSKNCHCRKGYIIQQRDVRPSAPETEFYSFVEFHPYLFEQLKNKPFIEFNSFDSAVDEFFSKIESQKINLKAIQQEKQVFKKLENVKKDHSVRIENLQQDQNLDLRRGELVLLNSKLVDDTIMSIRSAVASQLDWEEIDEFLKEAQEAGDPLACRIKLLNLKTNHFSILLGDPYDVKVEELIVSLDLGLSAQANARRFFHQKKFSAAKERKTVESQAKAFRSAEKKTKANLKEMSAIVNISKARKTFWFEKFFWFITSENYLVIAGRDQQQNEFMVKRYLRAGDIYVHADIHGASTVIIKNPLGGRVPPKTLNEAGQMAVCYSAAWTSKILASAYWVNSTQVSKSAPTGEYLTTGSFMIRGKKNFLLPSDLIMGFGFIFKLEQDSIARHKDERRVRLENLDCEAPVEEMLDCASSIEEDEEEEVQIDTATPYFEEEQQIIEIEANDLDDTFQVEFPDTVLEDSSDLVQMNLDIKSIDLDSLPVKDDISSVQRAIVGVKRGKKGKMKKIKGKYAHQDEEERKICMQILQTSQKASSKRLDKIKKVEEAKKRKEESLAHRNKMFSNAQQKREDREQAEKDEDIEEPSTSTVDEVDMLSSLTGIPVAEDEILFAVPVVGPYVTMANYKFKVKMTPGTTKRGKASKIALNLFLRDKSTSPRDRELLKSVKDQEILRNIPGSVKLSAPNLQNSITSAKKSSKLNKKT